MSVPMTRPLPEHKQVAFVQGSIMRSASPWFAPPVPAYMREPGTYYTTLITAPGPHTTSHPGVTGGITPPRGKYQFAAFHPQGPVPPLTRKGG